MVQGAAGAGARVVSAASLKPYAASAALSPAARWAGYPLGTAERIGANGSEHLRLVLPESASAYTPLKTTVFGEAELLAGKRAQETLDSPAQVVMRDPSDGGLVAVALQDEAGTLLQVDGPRLAARGESLVAKIEHPDAVGVFGRHGADDLRPESERMRSSVVDAAFRASGKADLAPVAAPLRTEKRVVKLDESSIGLHIRDASAELWWENGSYRSVLEPSYQDAYLVRGSSEHALAAAHELMQSRKSGDHGLAVLNSAGGEQDRRVVVAAHHRSATYNIDHAPTRRPENHNLGKVHSQFEALVGEAWVARAPGGYLHYEPVRQAGTRIAGELGEKRSTVDGQIQRLSEAIDKLDGTSTLRGLRNVDDRLARGRERLAKLELERADLDERIELMTAMAQRAPEVVA